jgi:cobalt-zinc-cadmium efflux system protein
VAALAIQYTGLLWLDPLTSLVIVAVIAGSTWGVLRDAAHLSLDGVPRGVRLDEVDAYLRGLPGVIEVHDLHVWALSTTTTALTAHLVHAEPQAPEHLLLQACHELDTKFRIGNATLQLETRALAEGCKLRSAGVV